MLGDCRLSDGDGIQHMKVSMPGWARSRWDANRLLAARASGLKGAPLSSADVAEGGLRAVAGLHSRLCAVARLVRRRRLAASRRPAFAGGLGFGR